MFTEHPTNQKGFTLIELMISILIGLFIIAAAITVYVLIFRGTTDAIRSSRLNYDLNSLVLLMENDIRRAGYWAGARSGWDFTDDGLNPFTAASTGADLTIYSDWNGAGDYCVLYAYDRDGEGDIDSNEAYGFRANIDGSISMRLSVTDPSASSSMASCADSDGTWEPITVTFDGESIRITDFFASTVSVAADSSGADGSGPYPPQSSSSQCDNADDVVSTADATIDCSTLSPSPSSGDVLSIRRIVNLRVSGQVGRDSNVYKSLATSVTLGNDAIKLVP